MIVLLSGIGSISGISGGVITIPFSLLFLNFLPKQATAFSNVLAFFLALIKTSFNFPKRDPKKKTKTLIDYNLCLIMNPAMVFANVFGSIINDTLPNGLILILLMILIVIGIFINIFNVIKKIKEENKMIKEEKENKENMINKEKEGIKMISLNMIENEQTFKKFESEVKYKF